MIAVAAGVKVLVATKPVDFRKGADGLVALVREALGHDPFSETIFIFRSKRADRLKILAWDGSGLVLFWKRLEHGAFRWPPVSDGVMRLTAPQLAQAQATQAAAAGAYGSFIGGAARTPAVANTVYAPTATAGATPVLPAHLRAGAGQQGSYYAPVAAAPSPAAAGR